MVRFRFYCKRRLPNTTWVRTKMLWTRVIKMLLQRPAGRAPPEEMQLWVYNGVQDREGKLPTCMCMFKAGRENSPPIHPAPCAVLARVYTNGQGWTSIEFAQQVQAKFEIGKKSGATSNVARGIINKEIRSTKITLTSKKWATSGSQQQNDLNTKHDQNVILKLGRP